jgi:PadR family transcriptional regulator PadR
MADGGERSQDNRQTQLKKGVAEMALLTLLRSRAHYGLELLDRLNAEAGLDLAEGTIYPLLHRLEAAGLVRAEWRTETENGRPRKYYSSTPKGVAELASMIGAWRAMRTRLDALIDGAER